MKPLPQLWQMYGLSPLWLFRWTRTYQAVEKRFWQISQTYRFFVALAFFPLAFVSRTVGTGALGSMRAAAAAAAAGGSVPLGLAAADFGLLLLLFPGDPGHNMSGGPSSEGGRPPMGKAGPEVKDGGPLPGGVRSGLGMMPPGGVPSPGLAPISLLSTGLPLPPMGTGSLGLLPLIAHGGGGT